MPTKIGSGDRRNPVKGDSMTEQEQKMQDVLDGQAEASDEIAAADLTREADADGAAEGEAGGEIAVTVGALIARRIVKAISAGSLPSLVRIVAGRVKGISDDARKRTVTGYWFGKRMASWCPALVQHASTGKRLSWLQDVGATDVGEVPIDGESDADYAVRVDAAVGEVDWQAVGDHVVGGVSGHTDDDWDRRGWALLVSILSSESLRAVDGMPGDVEYGPELPGHTARADSKVKPSDRYITLRSARPDAWAVAKGRGSQTVAPSSEAYDAV